jgi:hypothetical protein
MRVIIAGGRDYHEYKTLLEAINQAQFDITTVVSGGAKGVDALGEQYAIETNKTLHIYEADWERHGRAAGPLRNKKMAENADALIAIWDGKSRGTKNMIETAHKHNLLVFVKYTNDGSAMKYAGNTVAFATKVKIDFSKLIDKWIEEEK